MWEYRNLIAIIIWIGIAQAILLSGFLVNKKVNRNANILLSAFFLLLAFFLLYVNYILTDLYIEYPQFIGAHVFIPYLFGPSIYLYVFLLSRVKAGFPKKQLIHYLPFLLTQIYGIFFIYFESNEFKLNLVEFNSETHLLFGMIEKFIPIHGVVYIFFALIEAKKFNNKIKTKFSNIDKINLDWMKIVIIGTAVIWTVLVISNILNHIYGDEFQYNLIVFILFTLLMYYLGFKGLQQPEVPLAEKEISDEAGSYEKSGLTDEKAESMSQTLIEFIEREKPYLNNKLSLSDLASSINISNHNLSEVINKKRNQNFYDFVNSYRVEEVKRLIKDDEEMNYSILALGYEAGFSSKSAFYTAFKKFTDQTPAQYRDQFRLKKMV